MIATLVGGFVSILVGVSLIGPVATTVNTASAGPVYNSSNLSQLLVPASDLYQTAQWGATVLQLVPGFFALGILGIGLAVTYSALQQAGVL